MNWFDIFIVIILLRTSYIGFKNGLSDEMYKVANLGISSLTAFYFYKKLVLFINQWTVAFADDNIINIISFLSILFICMLLLKFIFAFIQKAMQLSFAKNFNSIFGMVFGICRGAVISCMIFMLFNWSTVDYIKISIKEKSFSGQYIIITNSHFKSLLVKSLPE